MTDATETLNAFRLRRKTILDALRTVKLMGVAYHGANMVIAAIDGMGVVLAGQLEPFAIGSSVGSG